MVIDRYIQILKQVTNLQSLAGGYIVPGSEDLKFFKFYIIEVKVF